MSPRKGLAPTPRGRVWEVGGGLRTRFGLGTCPGMDSQPYFHCRALSQGRPMKFPSNFAPSPGRLSWPRRPPLSSHCSVLDFSVTCCLPWTGASSRPAPESIPSDSLAYPLQNTGTSSLLIENCKVGPVSAPSTPQLLRHQPGMWVGLVDTVALPGSPIDHT